MGKSMKWLLKNIQQNPGRQRKKNFGQCLVQVGVGRRSPKENRQLDSLHPFFYFIFLTCHSEVGLKSTQLKKLILSPKPFILMIICLTRKMLPFLKLLKTWKV